MSAMNIVVMAESSTGWLQEGVTALIAGMGTVFIILILISLLIGQFKHIKTGEIKHPAHDEAKINAVVENKPAPVEEKTDDLELVAVITAAIAMALGTSGDKLQVKSFRRVSRNNRYIR